MHSDYGLRLRNSFDRTVQTCSAQLPFKQVVFRWIIIRIHLYLGIVDYVPRNSPCWLDKCVQFETAKPQSSQCSLFLHGFVPPRTPLDLLLDHKRII